MPGKNAQSKKKNGEATPTDITHPNNLRQQNLIALFFRETYFFEIICVHLDLDLEKLTFFLQKAVNGSK